MTKIKSRQGWRKFICEECGFVYRLKTRDFHSLSSESCPKCQFDNKPEYGWLDEALKIDKFGNLI